LPLLCLVSVLGCTDDDPVAFKSKEPFDAVLMDGSVASAYGLRLSGEERTTICSSCSVLAKSPAGDHVLLTRSDQEFFVAEPGRVNEVLDLGGAAVDGAPTELPALLEAAWSPDSKHVALLWGTSQAYVGAADGTRLVPIATGAFDPTSSDGPNIVWSKDSSHVAFELADGVLAITDAAGSSNLTLPPGTTSYQWSPDGGHFAFANLGVSLVDTGTLETRVVSETATSTAGWSPSGEWLAYFDGALVLAPVGDSEPVVLPLDGLSTAAWSPVADELVYGGFLERDGPGVTVVLGLWSPDRTLPIPVDSEVVNQMPQAATWSPDGTRFFYRIPDSNGAAYSALTDASDGSELARFPADYDPVPVFSRDGSWLATTSTQASGGSSVTDLSVSDASGSGAVVIASGVEAWQWLGDGTHLLLVTGRSVVIASADGSGRSTRLSVSDGTQIGLVR
jgi:Tol biopolymer transport system component